MIEEKQKSLVWHYRLADPDFGSWQAKECQVNLEASVLTKFPVDVLVGKKNLEVRSFYLLFLHLCAYYLGTIFIVQ